MAENIRVRFAPSPTGFPHIGNIRTAFFNWLFARSNGGKFIVRVEDTDQERLVPGAVDAILDGLVWLGIDWDEGPRVDGPFGPYLQSERLDLYRQAADRLIAQGNAYRCYCTRERLAEVREVQQKEKRSIGYDRHCKSLTKEQCQDLDAAGAPSVVRFAMPGSGTTEVNDLIRGQVEWQNELVDDFVLLKSDGFPTYHLAVVVDDHLMEISHVLRAEEWLSSTPRHLQLYRAFDYPPPRFGHLPMILGPDRSKLSKRHGATSIMEYRDAGYLPEALKNFMVLLGWSLDDQTDVMPLDVIIKNFSLERVGKPAAIFDLERLGWMNGIYIRQLAPTELAAQMLPFLERDLPAELLPVDWEYFLRIVPLIQERLKLLSESAQITSYFFEDRLDYSAANLVQKGMDAESAVTALQRAGHALIGIDTFEAETIEQALRATAVELEFKPREFFGTLREAITARSATPSLFEVMAVLGKDRVLARFSAAAKQVSS
ncbi:MAG: glutamate--tRNA ligase [Chloroflexi bacterium]|nr:glutamate--tRNA ligase [Chloroflexota bacterium]MDA1220357.1 glutamate--tRNA ligase [Chloroflexota bacterium]PKB57270.1 MAG: glutamate--tRNA ligase [SAR202 cluster bacterium Casp-Chloro-G3]